MKHTKFLQLITWLIALVMFLTACGSSAPKAPISGKVQFAAPGGKYTGAGIEVHLSDPALLAAKDPNSEIARVFTDEQGNYTFPDVKPGSYSLGVLVSDIEQVLSSMVDEECTLEGMSFDGEWLIVLGTSDDGKSVLIAAQNGAIELKEGETLTYDLTVECK